MSAVLYAAASAIVNRQFAYAKAMANRSAILVRGVAVKRQTANVKDPILSLLILFRLHEFQPFLTSYFILLPATAGRGYNLLNSHLKRHSSLRYPHHRFHPFYELVGLHSIIAQFLLHSRLSSVFFNPAKDHFQHIMRFGILP
jgi:hypothetical protein